MKKITFLIITMLLPLIAMADAVEVDGIYYNLIPKGKVAEVTSNPNKYTGKVAIPESVTYDGTDYTVTRIGDYAFDNCSGLTSITIPNTVTSIIGKYTFRYCFGLTSVHISDVAAWCNIKFESSDANPLYYAHHLYQNGEEIKNLVIPNSVTSIGDYAFYGYSALTSITIPSSVTSIGNSSFYGCSGLISVHISDVAAWCNIKFWSSYDNPLYYAHHLYQNGEEIKNLVIPSSVTSIGLYAFYGCSGLTSITIPNSVTSIGTCSFDGCSGLTSITIPNSVTSIGLYAFSGCSGLTSITIPNSVTSIDYGVFSGCSGLTTMKIESGNTEYDSRYNCNAIIHTASDMLVAGCMNTVIPNNVTSIGLYAFSGCSGLTSITIPNSVTSIDNCSFYGCSGLTSVTIGSGIESIDDMAFESCPELKDVYCYATNVPNTGSIAFQHSYIDYATLHVPAESVNAYKAADPWKNFKSIVSIDGGDTPEPQKCEKPSISYQNGQLKMSCSTEGVEYVTDIVDADVKKHFDATISLTATYNISVYATKTGYINSDVATATLCWIDQEPTKEGIVDGIVNVPSRAIMISSDGGLLTINGAEDGTLIEVYKLDGTQAGASESKNGSARIYTNLQPGNIAIVKTGKKSVKVVIR